MELVSRMKSIVVTCSDVMKWYPEHSVKHALAPKKQPCCYSPTPDFELKKPAGGIIGGALHELFKFEKGKNYRITVEELPVKKKTGFTIIELLIVVAILGIVGTLVMSAVKNPSGVAAALAPDTSRAQNALNAYGFKDVRLTSPSWFICGKDDSVFMSNDFTANNPAGTPVHGTVCCGYMKGCTVRF